MLFSALEINGRLQPSQPFHHDGGKFAIDRWRQSLMSPFFRNHRTNRNPIHDHYDVLCTRTYYGPNTYFILESTILLRNHIKNWTQVVHDNLEILAFQLRIPQIQVNVSFSDLCNTVQIAWIRRFISGKIPDCLYIKRI